MHSLIHLFVALLYVMSELADRAHGEQVCTACRSVEESAWFGKDYKIVSDSWKKETLKYKTNAEDSFGVNFQLYCIKYCGPVSED